MHYVKRALEAAAAALQLAIDARELTMHEFQRKYGTRLHNVGWITRELEKALRKINKKRKQL